MANITPLQFIKRMCQKQDLKDVLNGTTISVWSQADSILVNVIIPQDQDEPFVQYIYIDSTRPQEIDEIPLTELDRDQIDKIVEILVEKCEDIGDEHIAWPFYEKRK